MYTCFRCTRPTGISSGFTWLFCCHGDHESVGSCLSLSCYWKLLCHLPHQQHHIVLAHHWNTSISFHFVITLFFSPGFPLFSGVERPWRPCHHLSPVLWKPHSERLRRQHTQSMVCCYWEGEFFIYIFIYWRTFYRVIYNNIDSI